MAGQTAAIGKKCSALKIAVVGAGAIGCYFGGLLARQHVNVVFVARNKTLERLRHHELIVKSVKGNFKVPVHVIDADHLKNDSSYDFILLAVKSTAIDEVMPELQALSGPRTKIICLLNGIGNEEKLAERFGDDRIVGGSAFISIIREAPAVVNHIGEERLAIGEWKRGTSDPGLVLLAELFRKADVKVELTADIRRIKWEKLLWNIVYNPVTALTGTRVGEALADPDLRALLTTVKAEYLAVAQAEGIQISGAYSDQVLLPDQSVQYHKTSMLQDYEHGRKMELESILGFAIKTAHRHGTNVRTIEALHHLLRFTEKKQINHP